MEQEVKRCLKDLSEEARDLYLPSNIPVLDAAPTPLAFLREYVSKNRPVIIKNALSEWSALSKWTSEYLYQSLASLEVSVAVTPNGYADAPLGDRFVLPEERIMPFDKFLKIWQRKEKSNGVFYIQKQNSNFTDEFGQLMADAGAHYVIEYAQIEISLIIKRLRNNFYINNYKYKISIFSVHQ